MELITSGRIPISPSNLNLISMDEHESKEEIIAEKSIDADLVILACGTIEVPKILEQSISSICPTGLGNQNDLVGRFFMEHLHFWSGIYKPSDPDIFSKTGLYDRIHTVNGVPIVGKLAFADEILRERKMVNHCVELIPRLVLNSSLCRFIYPKIRSESVTSFNTVCRPK